MNLSVARRIQETDAQTPVTQGGSTIKYGKHFVISLLEKAEGAGVCVVIIMSLNFLSQVVFTKVIYKPFLSFRFLRELLGLIALKAFDSLDVSNYHM